MKSNKPNTDSEKTVPVATETQARLASELVKLFSQLDTFKVSIGKLYKKLVEACGRGKQARKLANHIIRIEAEKAHIKPLTATVYCSLAAKAAGFTAMHKGGTGAPRKEKTEKADSSGSAIPEDDGKGSQEDYLVTVLSPWCKELDLSTVQRAVVRAFQANGKSVKVSIVPFGK